MRGEIPSVRFDLVKNENSRCPDHERGRLFRSKHLLSFAPKEAKLLTASNGIEIVFENQGHIFAVGRFWRVDVRTGPAGKSAERRMVRNGVFIFKSFCRSMRELENDTRTVRRNRA
jgi:hypothetical protein